MASLLRRLRRSLPAPPPGISVVGYGSPGVVKLEWPGGPAPGLCPVEAVGLAFAGAQPPVTHVHVLPSRRDRG